MRKIKLLKCSMLTVYALLIIIPVLSIVSATFKTPKEMYENIIGMPDSFSLNHYWALFSTETMNIYFFNSVIVTVCSTVCTLFLASLLAYSIARLSNGPGNAVFVLFALGMMVPAQVNMGPLYDLVRTIGLTNTRTGLIFVNVAATMPVAVFILTGFMKSLPKSLFEAGTMDGASHWAIYRKIAVPLSLPSLAAASIFLFVMHWNDLFYPLLLITDSRFKTLPLALLEFQGEYLTNYPMLFTGVVIASAPMVLAYILLQRFFIAGITAGSIKG